MYRKILISTLLLGSVIWSCKQESSEPAPAETSSFELLQTKIITPSCAIPGCHASEKDGLVLTKDLAYDRIINVTPKNANAIKDGLKLVKPFSSAQSLFYHKLEDNSDGHHASDYGKRMPIGGKFLTNNQIEFVRRWIAAGAPKTGDIVDKKLLD
jgi:hypothetical protein